MALSPLVALASGASGLLASFPQYETDGNLPDNGLTVIRPDGIQETTKALSVLGSATAADILPTLFDVIKDRNVSVSHRNRK